MVGGLPWLHQGDETSREELADLLGLNGVAALRRGMFKKARGRYSDQLLLFHDPFRNPYGDELSDEHIHYVGQGQTGDQKLHGMNRYLAEHLKEGYTVHFFRKKDRSGTLVYEGEVVCENVQRVYRPDEERSVLEFELLRVADLFPTDVPDPLRHYRDAQAEIQRDWGEPTYAQRPVRTTVGQRLIRDVAFRDTVLEAYSGQCAVCGEPLIVGDVSELEAAHILGVAERGTDDPRNGMSLCVRHHWAFDHGVFTVRDDLTIQSLIEGTDPHGEIEDRAALHAPEEPALEPHPWYLKHHRAKWATT